MIFDNEVVQEGFMDDIREKMKNRKEKKQERKAEAKRKKEELKKLRAEERARKLAEEKEAIDKSYDALIRGFEQVLEESEFKYIKTIRKETLVYGTINTLKRFEEYSSHHLEARLIELNRSIPEKEKQLTGMKLAAGIGGILGTLLSDDDTESTVDAAKKAALDLVNEKQTELDELIEEKASINAILILRNVMAVAQMDITFYGLNESTVFDFDVLNSMVMESLIFGDINE